MGGRRDSELGRRHGPEVIRRFTEPQTITTNHGVPLDRPDRVPGGLFARGPSVTLRVRRLLGRAW